MKIQFVAAFGAVGVLSACGGSSSGTSDIPSFASLSAFEAASDAAFARIEPLDPTPLAAIPTTGTADFAGTIVLRDDSGSAAADATVAGGMALTLDFDSDAGIVGTAGNFIDLADTPVDGTLTLQEARLSTGDTSGSVAGNLRGQLSNVGRTGTDADYDYDVTFIGLYFGDNLDSVVSFGSGTATEVGETEARDLVSTAILEQ